MPRWLKLTLLGVVGAALLAAVALVALVHAVDVDGYARESLARVKEATGRELRVGGRLSVSLFPQPGIVAEDVALANAAWSSRKDIVRMKRLEGRVALLPLLRGEVRIARLVIVEPDVLLERNAKGEVNWRFGPTTQPKPAAKGDRAAFGIDALEVVNGRVAYRAGPGEPLALDVERLTLAKRALAEVDDVSLTAKLRGQAFTIKGSMGSIASLLADSGDWPVDLAFATAGASAAADGHIDWRRATPAAHMDVRIEVKDPGGLAQLTGGMHLPTPLALTAKLTASRTEQRADPIALTVGKTGARGRIAYRTDGPRPFVDAELVSPGLDLSGGPRAKPAKSARVFSDAPFPLDALRAMDGAGSLRIDRLVLPNGIPLEGVDVRAKLKGGRLDVQPLGARVGGGTVGGSLAVDAAPGRASSIALDVRGRDIKLGELAAATGRKATLSGGSTDLGIALRGPGESTRRFMAGADGELRIVVGPMRVSGLNLEAGGDALSGVLDAAMPGRRREPYTDVRCAVVRLPVRNGVATSNRSIAYETSKVNLVAAGTIDFRSEALDLAIRPTVKEGLGIGAMSLAELVKVTGTLANPSIGLDTLGSAKAALTVGGAVLTGGLSLLGQSLLSRTGDQAPCQTALGVAPQPAPAAAPAKKEDEGLLGSVRRLFR